MNSLTSMKSIGGLSLFIDGLGEKFLYFFGNKIAKRVRCGNRSHVRLQSDFRDYTSQQRHNIN